MDYSNVLKFLCEETDNAIYAFDSKSKFLKALASLKDEDVDYFLNLIAAKTEMSPTVKVDYEEFEPSSVGLTIGGYFGSTSNTYKSISLKNMDIEKYFDAGDDSYDELYVTVSSFKSGLKKSGVYKFITNLADARKSSDKGMTDFYKNKPLSHRD